MPCHQWRSAPSWTSRQEALGCPHPRVRDRLLIDECLSVELPAVALALGLKRITSFISSWAAPATGPVVSAAVGFLEHREQLQSFGLGQRHQAVGAEAFDKESHDELQRGIGPEKS